MLTRETFEQCLQIGHQGEEAVRQILVKAGHETYVVNRGSGRDLQTHIGGLWHHVEVKNEVGYDENSRNICIETHQCSNEFNPYGRLSGITMSEAHVWIHIMGTHVAMYRRLLMLKWLRDHRKKHGLESRRMGDNGNRCLLVPKALLRDETFFDFVLPQQIPNSKVWRAYP